MGHRNMCYTVLPLAVIFIDEEFFAERIFRDFGIAR